MQPTWATADGAVKLFLADCRDVLPTLADGSIDFIFSDPPYGHNNNNGDLIHRWEAALGRLPTGSTPVGRPIANDGQEANELIQWSFREWNRLISPGCCCCCCCCCGGGGPDPQFARWSLWLDESIGFKQMVVWDKGPMGMGWHYRRSYETILVGEKPGAACRWYDETNAVENVIRPSGRIRKIIPNLDEHPTEKPVELPAEFIRLHSQPGHLICDPFMGRASTGIACIRMGRRFIGIEYDREHFDKAVTRIEDELNRAPLFDPPPVVQSSLFQEAAP